jgi:hypothetical protein
MILSALKFCAFSSALISSTSLALSLSFSITSSSEIEPGAHAAVNAQGQERCGRERQPKGGFESLHVSRRSNCGTNLADPARPVTLRVG